MSIYDFVEYQNTYFLGNKYFPYVFVRSTFWRQLPPLSFVYSVPAPCISLRLPLA